MNKTDSIPLKRGMKPPHPGAILADMLDGLREESGHKYSQAEIAAGLGITRKTLSRILNERQRLSCEMCIRLSKAFSTSTDLWSKLQREYDLWHAEKKVDRSVIQHFVPAKHDFNA